MSTLVMRCVLSVAAGPLSSAGQMPAMLAATAGSQCPDGIPLPVYEAALKCTPILLCPVGCFPRHWRAWLVCHQAGLLCWNVGRQLPLGLTGRQLAVFGCVRGVQSSHCFGDYKQHRVALATAAPRALVLTCVVYHYLRPGRALGVFVVSGSCRCLLSCVFCN
jgi:hypothetical protein